MMQSETGAAPPTTTTTTTTNLFNIQNNKQTDGPNLSIVHSGRCDCHPEKKRPKTIKMVREAYHNVGSKHHPGEFISIEVVHCRQGLMAQLALLKNPKARNRGRQS